MAFSFTYPYPMPSSKGWGPGWPNCQTDKIKPHPLFPGGVHRNIEELVNLLVAEMERRGFQFMKPGCWGYGCRGTKTSSGSTTGTPSVHSWGLAIDINAPRNVFGADKSTSEIATKHRWVVKLMRAYGFYWLGPPIKDWMHFHFAGTPADAKRMTRKARRNLAPAWTIKGKVYRKLDKAVKRAKALLKAGKAKVTVKRR